MTATPIKDSRIAVRLSALEKELLERGATAAHMTLTEFVVKASVEAADLLLAEQTRFEVSDEHFEWLLDLVNSPTNDNPGFERLMRHKSQVSYDA